MVFWSGICIGVTLIWVLYSREIALASALAASEEAAGSSDEAL